MTNEEAIVKAVGTKLKNRFYAEKGQVDLDFIESGLNLLIEELRDREVPETLADKLPEVTNKEKKILNERTSNVVQEARSLLYNLLSDYIMDPEFDPNGFLSALVYWYEFQQLAKAYGKKLLYIDAKRPKEKK